VGGNHDSWGGSFWTNELDAEYIDKPTEMELAGWSAWVAHGHGLVELDRTGLMMHRLTGHRLTSRAFRMIHPDLAFRMVGWLSHYLAGRRRDEDLISRSAALQAEFAKNVLKDRENVDIVVLGHTHRHALESVGESRWYLNPGAWIDGHRYAIVTEAGPELRSFSA
jgi:UDP-2,3-diacylglucosamine pyrophosphatase LpxH